MDNSQEANCNPRYFQNTKEFLNPVELQFVGKIPSWLQGSLYSIAPGTFDLEKGSVKHWMDGYGIISKFEISGNSLRFSSKHLQSTSYKKALEAGQPVVPEFGTPPGEDKDRSLFSRLMLAFTPNDMTDNNIGRIVQLGSKLYSLGDVTYFHEIDPNNLNSLATLHSNTSFGLNVFSSEILKDKTGDQYMIGTCLSPTVYYTVKKMKFGNRDANLESKFETLGSIPSRWNFGSCVTRSCFLLTENYIVFVEVPLVLNALTLAATYIKGYTMIDWYDWLPEESARFYIMHKATGEVIETEIMADKAFFVNTLINAYEDGDKIVFDVFTAQNSALLPTYSMDNLRSWKALDDFTPGTFHRYIIPIIENIYEVPEGKSLLRNNFGQTLKTDVGEAEAIRIGDRIIVSPDRVMKNHNGFDMGIINPYFTGREHSFVYNFSIISSSIKNASLSKGISKIDLKSKSVLIWELGEGQLTMEPVFIPNPNSPDEEEEGVLVTVVKHHYEIEERDFVVVIDVKTMKEIARAEFDLNCPVAAWFHAMYIPN